MQLAEKEGYTLISLSYVFCTDDFLLNINQKYLNHNYYTDVITFDYRTKKNEIHGEIYISIDRVKDNATALSISKDFELHRVIFHGLLHLVGYRDKKLQEIKVIRNKEDEYLNAYFI